MKQDEESWRKNAETIRARGRECVSEYVRRCHSGPCPSNWEIFVTSFPVEWLKFGFANGYDPDQFISPRERYKRLSPEERLKELQASLQAKSLKMNNDDPKNGRPFDGACRQAATVACYLYDAWRAENTNSGINDYGHRSEMRDFAARAVVEDFFAWMFATPKFAWRLEPAKDCDSFIERVRVLMDKAKRRRELGVDWILEELEILASDEGLVIELPPQATRK